MSGLRIALIALAVAGLATGLVALAIVLGSEHDDDISTPWIVLALTLGWSFIGAGLYAWWRRPENRVGPLMTMVGFFWFLGSLSSADDPWVFTIGITVSSLWIGAFAHMLIAFPTGRVRPGFEHAVVVLGWTAALVLPTLVLLFVANPGDCDDCPENKLAVFDSATAADVADAAGVLATIALLGAVGFVLVRRWRSYGTVQRRALSPVVWTGSSVAAVGVAAPVPGVLDLDEGAGGVEVFLITP